MEVFAVTIFVSLLFGILFAVLFVVERSQRQSRSLEQQALLPLDDSGIVSPVPAAKTHACGGKCANACPCETRAAKSHA